MWQSECSPPKINEEGWQKMKKIIALLLTAVMLVSLLAACGGEEPAESTPATETTVETEPAELWAEYDTITIAEALSLCETYVDTPSSEWYYIIATVDSVDSTTYGQLTISDETGSIMVYGSYSADGSTRYDAMDAKPAAGDKVLLYGCLQNYKGNTKEVQKAYIIDFVSTGSSEAPAELPAADSTLTVGQALALPLSSGEVTSGRYYITATVESISNAAYGAMYITDETGTISVYDSYSADGSVGYTNMDDKPYKGDTVTLYCTIQNYNGTIEVKNAWIISVTHAESNYNEADYTSMTIADARNTATGTKVTVSGVVAQITYANGYIPSGIILADSTGSIYIYDGDLAARVKVGNTVTVAASKTYWILDTEQSNAAKFGYKGCNQLESAYLVSNDEGSTAFDTSWVQETTVKEILDTPVTEDITSSIYKVTAIIHKVEGTGFTNYYIDDLDDKTGTYAYTQCNGGDFEWLDAFDGKICTVYLVALNAKSTSSDCYWRFLPIAVSDDGFDVSTVNPAEHAVKYYGVGQFLPSYTGNPAMELIVSVDSELLNFSGVKLSYTSSDSTVISIDGNVMNCHKTGTATITVTGSYGGKTYSEKVTITVTIAETEAQYATVSDVIGASIGDSVTVKGIVGPSLVNKTGFYLIDDTGVIAVETSADVLETLEIGYEVVLTATRGFNSKGDSAYGQTCLKDAAVLVNNYGTHDYSSASFDGEISVADFYNLDITQDFTTSVYTMKATVLVEEGQYSANIYLTDGTVNVRLYCSGAGQYSWLKAFAGQEVTVEIAPCNWNSKNYYVGCVLSVIHEDGSKTLNTLNFD